MPVATETTASTHAPGDKQSNRARAKLHIRVEHSIRRLQRFRIFAERYRNRRRRFGLRLHLLAGILNYEMGLSI
ncbi:MAG: transposase family protein [Cyanobacteria bacterium J06626_4]